jgi:hypothetical protein
MSVKDDLPATSEYTEKQALEIVTPHSSTIIVCSSVKLREEWRTALRKTLLASKKIITPIVGIWDDEFGPVQKEVTEEDILAGAQDIPLDKRVKALEAALAKAKIERDNERKEKEALALAKLDLESRLNQTVLLLGDITKAKDDAENERTRLQKILDGKRAYSSASGNRLIQYKLTAALQLHLTPALTMNQRMRKI